MLKKFSLILLAIALVFGLMFVGCDPEEKDPKTPAKVFCEFCEVEIPAGTTHVCYCDLCDEALEKGHFCFCIECELDWEGDDEVCECEYFYRVLTAVQSGDSLPAGIGDVPEDERDTGKGYIVGRQFEQIKNAKLGSRIEVAMSGTTNLDWATIGAVGIGNLSGSPEVQFPPQNGTYTATVPVESLYRLNGFANATVAFVNSWGGHTIGDKIRLLIPKEDIDLLEPADIDFIITVDFFQFMDEEITGATIAPRFRMSQGAITIWYEGMGTTAYTKSQTKPNAAGQYAATFDVAAASYFKAGTGLNAGSFYILPTRPDGYFQPVSYNASGANQIIFPGIVQYLDDAEYLLLKGPYAISEAGTHLDGFNIVMQGQGLSWGAAETGSPRITLEHTAGDTFVMILKLDALNNFAGFKAIDGWNEFIIQGWTWSDSNFLFKSNHTVDNPRVWDVQEAMLVDAEYLTWAEYLPKPTDATNLTIGGTDRGFVIVEPK